ncbi:MAG: tetratricopeptide repeat protein [Chloroflexi bacterium]|nr:MAG: tetratricopeptide repeat protein [Chloroflexota bacterium]
MNVTPRRPLFNRRPESNIYRMFLWAALILAALWMIRGVDVGAIKPVGQPTLTPTRAARSYTAEGDAQFTTGNLDAAIKAYRLALTVDPNNAEVWAKMARIQVYSSALKTTDQDKRNALTDALNSINKAKELAPDDSLVAAIRAFVLDWNANPVLNPDKVSSYLVEAEQESNRALLLDPTNALALAFYAEILIDQQKLNQAEQYMSQALEQGQDLMDVHRVYASLLESNGQYSKAIEEYARAIQITPNMTFLYLRAGANYRQLAFLSPIKEQRKALYIKSLEYFDMAAKINEQLGVQDPTPYLSIAKTYSQMGEFFAAGRNVQKALKFKPNDADIFGQLGIVYRSSRNYEGSILVFKCAIRGCTGDESCEARFGRACKPEFGEVGVDVQGLPLSQSSVVYYYAYASVLAALSRPQDNKCPEAREIFQEVRAKFSDDSLIMQIIAEGETICQNIGRPRIPETPTPFGTPPEPDSMTPAPADLTATPSP